MENEERIRSRRSREQEEQPAAETQAFEIEEEAEDIPAAKQESMPAGGDLGHEIAEGKAALEALSELFAGATEIPLAHARLVSQKRFEDLSGQLRMSLPRIVRDADRILNRRTEILDDADQRSKRQREEADTYARNRKESADTYDRQTRTEAEEYRGRVMDEANRQGQAILQDAETRAKEIIDAANQRAQQMTEQSEITRRAQAYGNEILDDARWQASAMLQQATQRTDLMLSGAAAALSRSAGEMSKLRDDLLSGKVQEGQKA